MKKKPARKLIPRLPSMNIKLETGYPEIKQWGKSAFGVQDHEDYIHDAVVTMLEDKSKESRKLNDQSFLGLWRIHAQKAYSVASQAKMSRHLKQDVLGDNVASVSDSVSKARSLVRYMLPFIPFAARKVVNRIYVLGETVTECSKALGLTRKKVEYIQARAVSKLGKLVKQGSI